MEINILKSDLTLINNLSARVFTNNKITSNINNKEKEQFDKIKNKLRNLANFYKKKYNTEFGDFTVDIGPSRNAVTQSKTNHHKLHRVWSVIYKGNSNKQYSAQISFVINPSLPCIELGFYFGSASGRDIKKDKRIELENRLNQLGNSLVQELSNDPELMEDYNSLFDYGFQAYYDNKIANGTDWLNKVSQKPNSAKIIYRLYPNSEGVVEISTLSFYISKIIFLMSLIPSINNNKISKKKKPLTPEERAKQAEQRALIGYKGELFVIEKEEEKLKLLGLNLNTYLDHVSLKSDGYGYDIKSCDKNKNEIYIEVKTTTRTKSDLKSRIFHMSSYEYEFYKKHKDKYYLYRVYDIYGENPELEVVDMELVELKTDNYLIEIKTA